MSDGILFITDPYDENFARLVNTDASKPDYEIRFGRRTSAGAKDHYDIDLRRINSITGDEERSLSLTKSDVLVLTPMGNNWAQSPSYSSYYIIPFHAKGRDWVCVGKEHVVSHPVNGYYPVALAYIFSMTRQLQQSRSPTVLFNKNAGLACALDKLIESLTGNHPSKHDAPLDRASGDISRSAVSMPELDAAILKIAAKNYENGKPFFVRTLLLEPSMHPQQLRKSLMLKDDISSIFNKYESYLVGKPNSQSGRGHTAHNTSVSDNQDEKPKILKGEWHIKLLQFTKFNLGRQAILLVVVLLGILMAIWKRKH